MIRAAIIGLVLRLVVLATPPLVVALTGAAHAAPPPPPRLDLAATALNDRQGSGIHCHGLIVALPVVHLAG